MSSSTPEEVLSAHYSEDALLEEEDATEQDIHLALESDNSSSRSSCSSSWTSRPVTPGFQYHASLPMQAVIMEKSNDHFIVKIRRAVPSTSPTLDQTTLAEESVVSLTEKGKEETNSAEIKTNNPDTIGTVVEETAKSGAEGNICEPPEAMPSGNIGEERGPEMPEPCHKPRIGVEQEQVPDMEESCICVSDLHDAVQKLLISAGQEENCESLQEPYTSSCVEQGPDLPEPHQEPYISAEQEQTPDFPEPSMELEEAPNLLQSSCKNSHSKNTTVELEQPQIHDLKVPEKLEVSNATANHPRVSSAVVFPPEGNFDAYIDLTGDTPSEGEADSCHLKMESTLNVRGQEFHGQSLHKVDKREGKPSVGGDSLTNSVDIYTDLTECLSSETTLADDHNLEKKYTLNVDGMECQTSLDEGNKKRKKEADAGSSSAKRQRKETKSACGKNNRRSEEMVSVTKKSSSKRTESSGSKDPLLSTTSMSPLSLKAKNIVKKKGEVVISWTRNDDREILLECQKKGPSEKAFVSIAARLNKSPSQHLLQL
uniref:CASP8-associated protein 2 n=1 Tax=Sphenodon punctatus TaxID=8508 RepID=A0A8D0L1M6_SPHPU